VRARYPYLPEDAGTAAIYNLERLTELRELAETRAILDNSCSRRGEYGARPRWGSPKEGLKMKRTDLTEFIRRAREKDIPFAEIRSVPAAEVPNHTVSQFAEAYRETAKHYGDRSRRIGRS
jgi:hypothetical protein